MSKIFVQIASYRDKELLPTLRDIIKKSSKKNQITFGIMWQKDDTESIEEFSQDKNVRVADCDWKLSKGLGWARSIIQTMYDNEDYVLQLDSHHRFADNWDTTLISMLENLKSESEKPLLTTYAYGYDPSNDTQLVNIPCQVLFHDFKSSGTIWLNPVPIPRFTELIRPVKGRFVSGHYFFTHGGVIRDYAYDPDLYFAGDEITLSTRLFTMGYDIYHPHQNVVWHHYGRNDRAKHWTDHTEDNKTSGVVEKTWKDRDEYSKRRIRQLLGQNDYGIDLGQFGLGTVRSLEQYEKYAGVDFKNKRIQKGAIQGLLPPMPYVNDNQWNEGFKKRTPVVINNFQKEIFLQHIDKIEFFKLEFMNLQKQVIHNEMISKNYIINNNSLHTTVMCDYVPMRFILAGLDSDMNIVHMVQSDTRSNIHWN